MNLNFHRQFLAAGMAVVLAASLASAEDTNPPAITREELTRNYLQIQEQIHESQLAVQQSQVAAAAAARSHADALAARLQSHEQSVAAQRATDTEAARKTQQLTLLLAGAFGLAGLGIMLLMVYFQWRAFTQLAQISAQAPSALASVNGGVHELAAPGRATVESSNARLLDVVSQLEKRIHELEGGQRFLPEISPPKPASAAGTADPLAAAQKLLEAGKPQLALESVERFLETQPAHADALVKQAVALEKLGRLEEALVCCDRALAADGSLVLAHLHKGGLLNRLRRYDEALDCYECALLAQEKKPPVRAA